MQEKLEKIRASFGKKLVGNARMQKLVCETVVLFPSKIVNYVTKNVWFVSSFDDAWGFTFNGTDLAGKYLVFLSDELLAADRAQKRYTIAHEIGHVILRHRNAFFESQSLRESSQQEKEAHDFAEFYLKKANEKTFQKLP